MYLSKVRLINWRSYSDAEFVFRKPTSRRPLTLVGAMNGTGKTSLLIALYLGLYGRHGLRYCEGFSHFDASDIANMPHYRKAVSLFRRNHDVSPDDPTTIDLTFSPTLNDSHEEEIRVVRKWFFDSYKRLKQGDHCEELELYGEAGRPIRVTDPESGASRLERLLFPAHVMPAFFFDGEQAQQLVVNAGTPGIKKAVEVMFGARIMDELREQVADYVRACHQRLGGKKASSQRERELSSKLTRREELNTEIAELQRQERELLDEKERLESSRSAKSEEVARLGGESARDAHVVQRAVEKAERERQSAESALAQVSAHLGLALALSRMTVAVRNRLEAEEIRETWERVKTGTEERGNEVLAVAMPEPASSDNLLGHLSAEVRQAVRDRFRRALTQIYNPPPNGCAENYLFAHVSGDARRAVLDLLSRVRSLSGPDIREKASRARMAAEAYEDARLRFERLSNLPKEVTKLIEDLNQHNREIQEAIRRLAVIENEIRARKKDLHDLNAEITAIQDDLAKLGPEQRRIAVAERVGRVLDDLHERLRPIALEHLQRRVTEHFLRVADKRFHGGGVEFPVEGYPLFRFKTGRMQDISTMSGFERRAFGIAFSLALAEITERRIPLVIDTPLGNADSEYRSRLLDALTDVDLDQIIILAHDCEIDAELYEQIGPRVSQKFLVTYDTEAKYAGVRAGAFFGDKV